MKYNEVLFLSWIDRISYQWISHNDLLPVGLECCTGIAEVKGSNPVQAWIFFRLSFRNCKSCVYNCDDHPSFNSSLRSSHIWFSYIQNSYVFFVLLFCLLLHRLVVRISCRFIYIFLQNIVSCYVHVASCDGNRCAKFGSGQTFI